MPRDEVRELGFLLRSKFPILVVETQEEPRFRALIERAANLENLALFNWSCVDGLSRVNRPDVIPETLDLLATLRHIRRNPQNGVFVLADPQPFLDDPQVVRAAREIAFSYSESAKTLVFVGSALTLPPDLQRMSATFQMALPSLDEMRDLFREEAAFWKSTNEGRTLHGDQQALEMMLQHLVGFTRDDARRLIRQAIDDDGIITMEDVGRVLKHKHEALANSGILNLELGTAQFSEVGGQAALKRWLELRYAAFVGQKGTESLTAPKGVLLLGVQGSGKSLAAKSVAGTWKVPLLRLDFGALYNKFHGETERNLRESLHTAQAMAPCILWLDEVEKGLVAGDAGADGGVSRRILGTFLTWMNERTERVFIVATANELAHLPPELLRKGRFDEIFFVDLPDPIVRMEILTIHLKKRGCDPATFDLEELSAAADGFSGAELEQAVIAAQYESFSSGRKLDTECVLHEIQRTRPLSVIRAEEVSALRAWAAERTVRAD